MTPETLTISTAIHQSSVDQAQALERFRNQMHEAAWIPQGICPYCVNIGNDSRLDIFLHCCKCGWRPGLDTRVTPVTPREYLEIEAEQQAIIDGVEAEYYKLGMGITGSEIEAELQAVGRAAQRRIDAVRAVADLCPPPANLRPATAKDIVKGAVVWHNREGGYGWSVVFYAAQPDHPFRAYISDDGDWRGLDNAYIEVTS